MAKFQARTGKCSLGRRSRRYSCSCMSSIRQAKNPKQFRSMDELRDEMQSRNQGTSFAGLLNWLSENAFGDVAGKSKWSLALAYRWFVCNLATAFPQTTSGQGPSDEELLRSLQVDNDYVEQMALLMVCTEQQAIRVIRRYPQIVEMDRALLSRRLIGLKMALPECDVGFLVELQPRLFLEGDQIIKEAIIKAANEELRSRLLGADITAMIEADPGILFEDVTSGITGLLDLWPVGPDTLANSYPAELALAVRALSIKGPPRRL